MLRDYDIFERFPDGSVIWRFRVFGKHETQRKLHDFAEHSPNEFFAIDIQDGEPLLADVMRTNHIERTKDAAKKIA